MHQHNKTGDSTVTTTTTTTTVITTTREVGIGSKTIPNEITNRVREAVAKFSPSAQILNLYLWGSRYFGTFNSASDWDFLAVVDKAERLDTLIDGDVNVVIYDTKTFQSLIDDHVPWAIPFLFHEKWATIQQNVFFSLDLELTKLRRALFINTKVNLSQSRSIYNSNKKLKAKKRIFHCLQMLLFSLQIARCQHLLLLPERFVQTPGDTHGQILSVTEPNQYFFNVVVKEYADWKEYEDYWRPLWDNTEDIYKKELFKYVEFEEKHQDLPLKTPQWIREFSLISLWRYFSININISPTLPLVHLKYTFSSPTSHSKISHECNGLVIHRDSLAPVGLPYLRINSTDYDDYHQKMTLLEENNSSLKKINVDWDSVKVYPHVNGHFAMLYFFNDSWRVSSSFSCDGSEVFLNDISFEQFFWKLWKLLGYSVDGCEKHICYMFEVVSISKRKIHLYSTDTIYFHGARNINTLEELEPEEILQKCGSWKFLPALCCPIPETNWTLDLVFGMTQPKTLLKFMSQNAVFTAALLNSQDKHLVDNLLKNQDILSKEQLTYLMSIIPSGFMVRDKSFHRVLVRSPVFAKIKSLVKLAPQQQEQCLVELVSQHFLHPTVQHFPIPQFTALFSNIHTSFEKLCNELDSVKVQLLSENLSHHDLVAKADALLGQRKHYLMGMLQNGHSALEYFLNFASSRKVAGALWKWWKQSFSTAVTNDYCYKGKQTQQQ